MILLSYNKIASVELLGTVKLENLESSNLNINQISDITI